VAQSGEVQKDPYYLRSCDREGWLVIAHMVLAPGLWPSHSVVRMEVAAMPAPDRDARAFAAVYQGPDVVLTQPSQQVFLGEVLEPEVKLRRSVFHRVLGTTRFHF
jgi:hypothetical protein